MANYLAIIKQNKSYSTLVALAIFSAVFFGFASIALVQMLGNNFGPLLALPALIVIGLIFTLNRYLFFLLVILSRASLDSLFGAIKFGSFGLGAVLNALVILIALLTLLEKREKLAKLELDLGPIKTAWAIFLTLAFLSVAYTPTFLPGLKASLSFVSYAAIFAMGLYLAKNEKDFGKWMMAIVYSSIIPIIYAAASFAFGLGGVRFSFAEGTRVQSTFAHPNAFAFYLVVIITVSFYVYKSKPLGITSWVLKTLPLYVLILLAMLVLTKTRSAWVACYLFFVLYALFYERKFLIIVLAAPMFALLIPDVQERILDLQKGSDFGAGGYGRLNSYEWRKMIWTSAINWMSKSHYLFGYGLSSFIHYTPEFARANAFQMSKTEINAHSVYVQLFFELGIVGVTSFFYLIFAHLKTLLTIYKRDKLLIFTVIVLLVEFLFEAYSDNMLDYLVFDWYLWFAVGLALGLVRRPKVIEGAEPLVKSTK